MCKHCVGGIASSAYVHTDTDADTDGAISVHARMDWITSSSIIYAMGGCDHLILIFCCCVDVTWMRSIAVRSETEFHHQSSGVATCFSCKLTSGVEHVILVTVERRSLQLALSIIHRLSHHREQVLVKWSHLGAL